MCANFSGFGADARGQRPGRRFQLRGPRTKVHGPIGFKHVSLDLSQSLRGQVHRGQVTLMSGTRGHRRTSADNVLSLIFLPSFLRHFQSDLFSHAYIYLSLHWSLQYHPQRSHGGFILNTWRRPGRRCSLTVFSTKPTKAGQLFLLKLSIPRKTFHSRSKNLMAAGSCFSTAKMA